MSQTKNLITEAKHALRRAPYNPHKLAAIHTGITAGICLAVALINLLLSSLVNTDGLSGLGNQALVESAQSVSDLLVSAFSVFWSFGFTAAALRLARGQKATPSSLTKGFSRWGAVVRMLILQTLFCFALMFLAIQIGSILYTMTPASSVLQELIGNADSADALLALENLDAETMARLLRSMLPFVLIPMAIVLIPTMYLLRFSGYVLMDEPRCGAMYATVRSFRLLRKGWRKLLVLDIRYLWFYLLELVVLAIPYGGYLLSYLGISLPIDDSVVSTGFYALALLAELALYAWKMPQVTASCALLYDRLQSAETQA